MTTTAPLRRATPEASIIQAVVDRADRYMVGWQWWHYCACDDPTTRSPDGQAIVIDPAKPPSGDNLRPAKLNILSRPYPQLVSGTPRDWSFDPATRTFSARYTTARADGGGAFHAYARSEIAVPARQYPTGYAVHVDGGAIASRPGADVLVIAACPGARKVRVTVRPNGANTQSCSLPHRPRLRLTVAPRQVKAGLLARLRFRVSAAGRPVRAATVRLAGRHARTDRRGRATMLLRPNKPGRHLAVASRHGYLSARTLLRVL